jgi:orotidine-5'-phosphate decarboxylase
MIFPDRLDQSIARAGNPCVLGIDPHVALLPDEFAVAREPSAPRGERVAAITAFCAELVDLAAGRVPAVKPQSAFFELFGSDGALAWERVIARAHDAGLLVIGDVKRADIASTAAAYAQAHLGGDAHGDARIACDAITVSPFLGADALEPFLDTCRRSGGGVFVLLRTSNPGAVEIQAHGVPPLFERIAATIDALGRELLGACGLSSVGAVVGATNRKEIAGLRNLLPRTPFLMPGYGAQGASSADIAAAFLPGGRGALVNSSRGVAFAFRERSTTTHHWKDAACLALDRMIADVRAAAKAAS